MGRDFETLKKKLWEHFETASYRSGNWHGDDRKVQADIAVGTIGQALVDLYREEREAEAQKAAQGDGLKKGLG